MWQSVLRFYHQLGSPPYFYRLAGKLIPWVGVLTVFLLVPGWFWGLFIAPIDAMQGHSYRIIFLHVPAASVAMTGYLIMAVAGIIVLVWRMKVAEVMLRCIAPIGASFTLICLITGAIWGKPTWGTWWEWDARLTSMLILLFLYLGVLALHQAIDQPQTAARATSILSIVGAVNLPIIKYSVEWWNTLHQPATLRLTESKMAIDMLLPLLLCIAGAYALFLLLVLMASRVELLERERRSQWVRKEVMSHVD
jgi:heme exporter protein C